MNLADEGVADADPEVLLTFSKTVEFATTARRGAVLLNHVLFRSVEL